ncbi:uncharacterized protein LOC116920119 isoform X3 [Daphnia magna]|uniref:uncharacterized protein LOC116920119 isoform X3 n=1 Tax=Daphnia magna TaxID=35525 RepID=UPI001E1BD310|nr:uncharacterized protein LOC116920119 isoform X3 [Daphnia magna]
MWLALKTIENQLSRGVVASSSWRLDLIKMLYFIMDRQSIMVPRRGKRITAGKPAKNLTFSESYLGQRSVKSKVKKVREIGMCPLKKLARVAVGKPKKPAIECFNSSINSPPVISSNSLREQLSANNRNLNNFHVSPDSSPKSLRQHSHQQQTSFNNRDINNYHVSPDSSPKNLRQHSQQQNRFNNRDLNNYHISLGSSPISSSQNSQQQTSFAPISSTPVHKRNLIKETQSDSNSLSVSCISHHKGHDAEPSASNIKLPNEIVDYLTKSMVRQDELFRVVQSLVASRPITTSEEEHDDFVEKLPDFPISSMEDFLSLERELLRKRFNIYFVRYLISLGGGTLADSSKLLLRHCLDKDVAIEYSHQGKGKLKKKNL